MILFSFFRLFSHDVKLEMQTQRHKCKHNIQFHLGRLFFRFFLQPTVFNFYIVFLKFVFLFNRVVLLSFFDCFRTMSNKKCKYKVQSISPRAFIFQILFCNRRFLNFSPYFSSLFFSSIMKHFSYFFGCFRTNSK